MSKGLKTDFGSSLQISSSTPVYKIYKNIPSWINRVNFVVISVI